MDNRGRVQLPQKIDNRLLFGLRMKELKSELPSQVSFLAPYKTYKGEYRVKVVINKEEYQFTVPEDLNFTNADIEELRVGILAKCNP